ncbi:hypothetical protein LOC67_20980 [Stieleria sp. JC731]|uniref:hypothetical protein n=1 Tax=Pirellulaceae TaxID=2691357 RepID=UPI001E2FF626|nr:hypothetical protein [Stieleria sp. JC731]MCC9603030.1 hypothetical protein [Stieleria sp. JC731]
MSRLSRGEIIDPNEPTIVHAISRTVRGIYFLGTDPVSGKNFDYRKRWIEDLLRHFAGLFGIDLLCYSILSNHYHLVLRSRPDIVDHWSDLEVARRWLSICPKRRVGGMASEPTNHEIDSICNGPGKIEEIRKRLSDISWWMRLLNQRVAQRANREDKASGRFWQDRFVAVRIDDEESLLACAAYVELNPIRAAMAETIEHAEFTSIGKRIESEFQCQLMQGDHNRPAAREVSFAKRIRVDHFLSKLFIDERSSSVGSEPGELGQRCSNKGFLPINCKQFVELLDWSARQLKPGKRGKTPMHYPPVLERLGISERSWITVISGFDKAFSHVAAKLDNLIQARGLVSGRRFPIRPVARELWGSG